MDLKKINSKHKNYIISFVITFLAYSFFLLNSGYTKFYWDALVYWEVGGSMFDNNHFSLLNYGNATRGVLFPLLNASLVILSKYLMIDQVVLFKIFSAFIASFVFCFLIPETIFKLTGKLASISAILLFNALVFYFWGDYFNFPLTDFITLFLVIYCISLSLKPGIISSVLFGISLALIINTRPIYIISAPPLIIFYLLHLKQKIIPYLKNILIIFAAFFITSLPQLYINIKVWNNNTLLQPTDSYYKGESLYLMQLKWGIAFEKYETNVGECYQTPQVFYRSKTGTEIIKSYNTNSIKNYSEYMKIIFENPSAFAIIYFKHIFNALDLPNRTPYILSMKYNWVFHAINYFILFGLLIFISINIGKINIKYFFLLASLLLPVIFVIPTAIEVRFFLPIFIIGYTAISYFVKEIMSYLMSIKSKLKISLLLASFLLFLFICFYLSLQTANTIEFNVLC